MGDKKKGMLCTVSALVLGCAGLVLVVLSMLKGDTARWSLAAGLGCIALGNLVNLLHVRRKRRGTE